MKALIDPTNQPIQYIQEWVNNIPVCSFYPNSARVCQVEKDENIFPVAEPLYWVTCPDNAGADLWYCDTATNTILQIINAEQ